MLNGENIKRVDTHKHLGLYLLFNLDWSVHIHNVFLEANRKLSVLMSFDFMEVVVPWLGFGAATPATTGCDRISDTDVGFDTDDKKEVNPKNLEKWTKSIISEFKSNESNS